MNEVIKVGIVKQFIEINVKKVSKIPSQWRELEKS